MHNIEEVHCGAAIHAILQGYLQLLDATVEESLASIVYGKTDTLGLDGIPESAIANSLRNFDRGALLITEEVGAIATLRRHPRSYPPTFYLADPLDRSSQFQQFLSGKDGSLKIRTLLESSESVAEWEESFGGPASITGATSAITCIRYGVPIATAIVNFLTHELFVASRTGVFRFELPGYSSLEPNQISPEIVRRGGNTVLFRSFEQSGPSMDKMRYFTTFLGKEGYRENFEDSDLLGKEDTDRYIRHQLPGGPARPLYLSTEQPVGEPVGFIVANGEKIGEWIHWIPFVRFGQTDGYTTRHALNLYEVHHRRPWTKDGILMSTPPHYSIFSEARGSEPSRMLVDVRRLCSFSNPSRIRSTLLIAPSSNTWAITVMERHLYRPIVFADRR